MQNNTISKEKIGIVLAFFGTSHPSSLSPIIKIFDYICNNFPGVDINISFTSSIIRKIWQKRKLDRDYRLMHPDVPDYIYEIRGELASICDLQDMGKEYILVQPMHIAAMEEYHDLASVVRALNSIRTMKKKNMPFRKIILGKPLMGSYNTLTPYREDLERLAHALEDDICLAKERGGALIYIAHGNEYMPGGFFTEFEFVLNEAYPHIKTYVASLEGFPSIDFLLARLKKDNIKRVLVKPLMLVAGEHAKVDICGEEEDSVRSCLLRDNIDVEVILEGLGEKEKISHIIVENILDAFKAEGINLD